MDKSKELIKNTFIITIGRISTQFISFLLLPLYTTLLSTKEYGTVDIITTYVQLLLPIIFIQLDQALFRFMLNERKNRAGCESIISNATIFFFLQSLLLPLFYLLLARFVDSEYIGYFVGNVFAVGLSSYVLQMVRGFGDNATYAMASFISGALTVFCNVLFIAGFDMKVEGMLSASIIGNIAAAIFVLNKTEFVKWFHVNLFNKQILSDMVSYALPLVPNALIWWLVNASDRSIVLFFLGTSANGILAVAHKFPTVIMTLYNIFHLSWTESASLHLKEKDKDIFFSNVFDSIFRLFSSFCIMLLAVMPFVFDMLVNKKFSDAYFQIPIYTIASLFNIIVGLYSVVYIFEMKTSEIAKTSIISGLINVTLNLALIKYVGLYAASISSAVAFGVMAIYRAIDIRKYISQSFDYKVVFSVACILILGFISYYSSLYYLKIVFSVIALIYSILLNSSNISFIKNIINRKVRKG